MEVQASDVSIQLSAVSHQQSAISLKPRSKLLTPPKILEYEIDYRIFYSYAIAPAKSGKRGSKGDRLFADDRSRLITKSSWATNTVLLILYY